MTKPGRAAVLVVAGVLAGVASLPAAAFAQSGAYAPPRTAAGHPDLQGIWGNNSVTPLERPDAVAGKATLTAEELARVEATANALFALDAGDAVFGDQFFNVAITEADSFTSTDGGTGNYNQFWLVEREFNNRTSLIVDPPSGKLPPATLAGETASRLAREGRGRPAAWTVDRGLSERCITFGLPNLLAGYNSYYQIFQTADHVVIEQELIHTTRIIPLDGRPHVGDGIRQWLGDSRGRWEGDTLVVETRNFSPQSDFRGAREHLRLIERFTRVGPDEMHYEFTVDDATTWTAPWDGARAVDPHRRSDVRVRLSRREHRHGGHSVRRAGGRCRGWRAVTAAGGGDILAGTPWGSRGVPAIGSCRLSER